MFHTVGLVGGRYDVERDLNGLDTLREDDRDRVVRRFAFPTQVKSLLFPANIPPFMHTCSHAHLTPNPQVQLLGPLMGDLMRGLEEHRENGGDDGGAGAGPAPVSQKKKSAPVSKKRKAKEEEEDEEEEGATATPPVAKGVKKGAKASAAKEKKPAAKKKKVKKEEDEEGEDQEVS